jgi:hypothetical protein
MSEYGTPFVETEALLAVMNDDQRTAYDLIADMLPGEREVFSQQVSILLQLVNAASK